MGTCIVESPDITRPEVQAYAALAANAGLLSSQMRSAARLWRPVHFIFTQDPKHMRLVTPAASHTFAVRSAPQHSKLFLPPVAPMR